MMDRIRELIKTRDILTKVDYKTLTEILDSYLPKIPLSIKDFKNEKFELGQFYTGGSNLLFRARIIDSIPMKSFKSLRDISYISDNEKQKIKQYGRVNKPCESMFYASTELLTSCVETFSKGESMEKFFERGSLILVVGIWKIVQPLTLVQMISPERYFERFCDQISFNADKLTIDIVRQQNSWLENKINDKEQYEILKFFSEEFAKTDTKNHKEYMITNYFADRIFNRNPLFTVEDDIDGIWYPSVVSGYQETNLVFPPDKVDKKLEFQSANTFWCIYDKKYGGISLNPIEQGAKVNTQGEIKWKT